MQTASTFSTLLTHTLGKVAVAAGRRYVVPVSLPPDDGDPRALSIWAADPTPAP